MYHTALEIKAVGKTEMEIGTEKKYQANKRRRKAEMQRHETNEKRGTK